MTCLGCNDEASEAFSELISWEGGGLFWQAGFAFEAAR